MLSKPPRVSKGLRSTQTTSMSSCRRHMDWSWFVERNTERQHTVSDSRSHESLSLNIFDEQFFITRMMPKTGSRLSKVLE